MLERSNLFLVALDDRREWYRYHHLFAEVLQAHALRAEPEHVRALHARASLWHERRGATSDAVRHAMLANDQERVAELLERHWPNKDRSYESARWLARVKSLPSGVVRARPILNMGYAWALLNAGDLEAAELRLSEVAASLADDRYPSLPREHATARLYLAQSRGDVAGTAELARRVLELVPDGDDAALATASALLALAYWANGELDAAYTTFAGALAAMRRVGAELDAIRGEFVLGDIRSMQGRLHDAARIYEAGIALAAAHPHAETDELYLGLAELHRERDDLEEANRLLLTIQQTPTHSAHIANRSRWCVVMSRVAEANGDLDGALSLLMEAESSRRRDPLPVVRPIAAMIARIRIAQGKLADAARWMSEQNVAPDDELSFLREYDHITLARILIAQKQFENAALLLERLTAAALAGGRMGSAIETLVLQSVVQQKLGNIGSALDTMSSALELAQPEGYSRIFVDEGAVVLDLIQQVRSKPAARVLPGGALTTRELEIPRLLAAGMRNQEIAKKLFISPATVKRHIANVYNKLDARHRTEALKRAGALNLL
jgi:LuxR family maltose regulon positive regulatory protein